MPKVDFPSVSFCKKFMFDNPIPWFLDDMDNWKDTSPAYMKTWIFNFTTSRRDLFTYIHHRTDERQFPCDTLGGEEFSGGPCKFPFR